MFSFFAPDNRIEKTFFGNNKRDVPKKSMIHGKSYLNCAASLSKSVSI